MRPSRAPSCSMHGKPVPLPIPAGRRSRARARFCPPASRSRAVAVGAGKSSDWTVRDRDAAGAINWRAERAQARAKPSTRFGLAIDPDARVRDLPQVERALLAIVRAFEDIGTRRDRGNAGVLILDEPTPFLPTRRRRPAVCPGPRRRARRAPASSSSRTMSTRLSRSPTAPPSFATAASPARSRPRRSTHDDFVELIIGRACRAVSERAPRPVARASPGQDRGTFQAPHRRPRFDRSPPWRDRRPDRPDRVRIGRNRLS